MRLNLSVLSPCTGASYALEEQIQGNPGGGRGHEDRQAL